MLSSVLVRQAEATSVPSIESPSAQAAMATSFKSPRVCHVDNIIQAAYSWEGIVTKIE
jgi:hypothetical protein